MTMRHWIELTEAAAQGDTILITDLYDARELTDESEVLWTYAPPIEWDKTLTVRQMPPSDISNLKTMHGLPLVATYEENATRAQKRIVQKKMKDYDPNRIVVICDDEVVDGNHHAIAAILAQQPMLYVDLMDWD